MKPRGDGPTVSGMAPERDIETLSRDELIELVKHLVDQNEQLRAIIEEQRRIIDELTRGGKRQAAPFSKGTRKKNPKRPGRKAGDGPFTNRKAPAPADLTTPDVDVPVAQPACPECGGELESERTDFAYRTEIPAMPKPLVTRYRVEVCRCLGCGRRVRGRHPDVAADQYGATAHRVGERVLAVAHWLHYDVGVPTRKVPAILRGLTGVEVTQSAIEQDALRRAEAEVGRRYDELRREIGISARVHSDDTGWREGGAAAFLMTFETDETTVFQIRARHRNQEVREVIGDDYGGVLCTDRGTSYDARALAEVRQQKCIGHIQRSISQVLERKRGRARWFGTRLKQLLAEAVEARAQYLRDGKPRAFRRRANRVRAEISEHLRDRLLVDTDNQRLLNGIGWHHDRGNLLRFLDDPSIEPTNNAAERALRPAVIARKISQCTKNDRGSRAFEAFKSVTQTIKKRGGSVIDGLVALFRTAPLDGASP